MPLSMNDVFETVEETADNDKQDVEAFSWPGSQSTGRFCCLT